MDKQLYISKYCHITNDLVSVNGKVLFENKQADTTKDYLKSIYKSLEIKYPKFFKMDNFSKIAFLGAEFLLKEEEQKNIAIVFSNNASSLDTDRKHQESINDLDNYFPSPSIFVYTLPNIGIGEISIRHQLKSENAFFVSEQFNATLHSAYETSLLEQGKAELILGGWVNIDADEIDVFMYLIGDKGEKKYTKENIQNLYINK